MGQIIQLGCILRQNSEGNWFILEDQYHKPLNATYITQYADKIRLNFGFKAKDIKTFIAVPDDALCGTGYVFGTDVGISYANIVVKKPCDIETYLYVTNLGEVVGKTNQGVTSVSFDKTTGVVTINHAKKLEPLSAPFITNMADANYKCELIDNANMFTKLKLKDYPIGIDLKNGDVKCFYRVASDNISKVISTKHIMPQGNNIWVYGLFELED